MLQCIYSISFLCLLRFDEVLRIEMKDVEVMDKLKGHIKLTLSFRKTHQYGGKLFSLSILDTYEFRDQAFPSFLQSQRATLGSYTPLATLDIRVSIDNWATIQKN